jgi:catechol 2,3-dioxygenase-like lactoylglutathione lyase family enzyme
MGLQQLQHYTIEPKDMEATKNFYIDVLGLEVGDRPPLGFPRYWLYSGGVATVHLLGPREPGDGVVVRPAGKDLGPTGRFDHIAFAATDLKAMRARLKQHGVKYRENLIARVNVAQIFLYDPDGVGVELNFAPGDQ